MAGVYHGSKVFQDGALELLNLLRILGEGFRHLCMYRCQVKQFFFKHHIMWPLLVIGVEHSMMQNNGCSVGYYSYIRSSYISCYSDSIKFYFV